MQTFRNEQISSSIWRNFFSGLPIIGTGKPKIGKKFRKQQCRLFDFTSLTDYKYGKIFLEIFDKYGKFFDVLCSRSPQSMQPK